MINRNLRNVKVRPVILSSSLFVILSSSKDESLTRLRVSDFVTLRQAQSDILPVILSLSKDELVEG